MADESNEQENAGVGRRANTFQREVYVTRKSGEKDAKR